MIPDVSLEIKSPEKRLTLYYYMLIFLKLRQESSKPQQTALK
jgi:hypothetical protein